MGLATKRLPMRRLAERLTEVAIAASAAILAVDFRDCGARLKADDSPISRADEAAHAAIADGLARVAPGIAVISEEAAADWHGRTPPDEFLLVDPLDGTVEFLAGRLEYTVNIALVRGGTPVVGVIAAPALGLIWRGAVDHGAERLPSRGRGSLDANAERIHTRPWPAANASPLSAARTSIRSPRHFSSVLHPCGRLPPGLP
jgi:3'(2'), 5'-bisphosphate nucleotidase